VRRPARRGTAIGKLKPRSENRTPRTESCELTAEN
jgi:hypothetical protein